MQMSSADISLWHFLDELKTNLRVIREEKKVLRFSLRLTCEHFKVDEGCFAVLPPDSSQPELMSVIPRGGDWDLNLLAAFIRKQRPTIPRNIIMAPVSRRGRLWAVMALRSQGEFERNSDHRALRRIARMISE